MFFDRNDPRCRRPVGAAVSGSQVQFTALYATSATLFWRRDGGQEMSFPMTGEGGTLSCPSPVLQPGLYFYRLEGDGMRFPETGAYQLTVYDADYRAPDGWAGGIMYQIFPDRFAVGGGVNPPGFSDRVLHKSPDDEPVFAPDEQGVVRNNDYFGGNLRGITEKLPYLESLSVSCIYLNPIFEAHSNHRYNTADYLRIDPLLGTEDEFTELCREAHRRGIRVILDGVFSHTGDDSVYFNRYGRYDTTGAYQSEDSAYFPWYHFAEWPHHYRSWWGFETLPDVDEMNESYRRFICDEGGVIDYWLSRGADGLRLDVADELPDAFIEDIRRAVKRNGDDKLLIGEVWEDASNKVSYGDRRRFLWGRELDSVMNYPFREAILRFLEDGDAGAFLRAVDGICQNYPEPMLQLMMNSLSTHDTERVITRLALGPVKHLPREVRQRLLLDRSSYLRAVELYKMAATLQYTLPGIPCLYYGDEIGMQGGGDPFCRRFMRWDDGDENVLQFIRELGAARRATPALRAGRLRPLEAAGGACAAFLRDGGAEGCVLVAVNRGDIPAAVTVPDGREFTVPAWRSIVEVL